MEKSAFTLISALAIFSLLTSYTGALETCRSGNLTTSVHKDYQMAYPNEDFIQLDDKDLLKDLSQLKGLACLQYIDMTGWGVKGDVVNLNALTNLEVLSLYENPEVYGNICSLSGATKLRSLKFAFDPEVFGDISCLKDLNPETFAATNTKISGDLSGLSGMTNLKALYISGTGITGDISALSGLTNLEELGISDEYPGNSRITGDLASLANLTKLRKASLYKMKATNCRQFTAAHPNIQGGCSESKDPGKPIAKEPPAETTTTRAVVVNREIQQSENASGYYTVGIFAAVVIGAVIMRKGLRK
ncbi:MAG: hypothetical protein HY516_05165 [Candidatus Aenigmarchaeota archaeon]|nr:hypothetical protein [Candidatus Aenigmarchaeota archaeon]